MAARTCPSRTVTVMAVMLRRRATPMTAASTSMRAGTAGTLATSPKHPKLPKPEPKRFREKVPCQKMIVGCSGASG